MSRNNKQRLTIEDIAEFSWDYGELFLLETDKGIYEWSSPDYGGDNTIRPFKGDLFEERRAKGRHRIGSYCGKDVKIVV